jgi:hypothetical protein
MTLVYEVCENRRCALEGTEDREGIGCDWGGGFGEEGVS